RSTIDPLPIATRTASTNTPAALPTTVARPARRPSITLRLTTNSTLGPGMATSTNAVNVMASIRSAEGTERAYPEGRDRADPLCDTRRVAVTASALGACLLVALPLVGLAAHADESVLARRSGSAPAAASVEAAVAGVHGFAARVESAPDQHVAGTWHAVCRIGSDRAELSDTFSGPTPLAVSIPVTVTRAGHCTIAVTARGSRGRVTVVL